MVAHCPIRGTSPSAFVRPEDADAVITIASGWIFEFWPKSVVVFDEEGTQLRSLPRFPPDEDACRAIAEAWEHGFDLGRASGRAEARADIRRALGL